VLKLNPLGEPESEHEADALAFWDGRGAVRLLASDPSRGAILIERCRPGTQLWAVPDDEALDAVAPVFRALHRPDLPVVAAGFSVGGTLAFVYAANAPDWGLPRPRAVYSIFPADPYQIEPALDLSGVPAIPVVLRAGDHDTVVGRDGADTLAGMLRPGAHLDYRIIRSVKGAWADHYLPTLVWNPEVRRLFWTPLDRLVRDAQRVPR